MSYALGQILQVPTHLCISPLKYHSLSMAKSLRLALFAATHALLELASAISFEQALINQGSLSLLHRTLVDTNLLPVFEAADNVTFLAMTDEAIVYLADWGLNLTLIEPLIARSILSYHLLEGVQATANFPRSHAWRKHHLAHSVLRPPFFTNVSDGPVVKLSRSMQNSNHDATEFMVQSGLQGISNIVESDVHYDSGIIHAIDRNLVLPHNVSETSNLVNNLHMFWQLIRKAQAREMLEKLRDATIFLPHDDAVRRALPMLESLSPRQLSTVVANHVIPNHVLYHTLFTDSNKSYRSLNGQKIALTRGSASELLVNGVRILEEDVLIYGGVAHVIDQVLFPRMGKSRTCRKGNDDLIKLQLIICCRIVSKSTTHQPDRPESC